MPIPTLPQELTIVVLALLGALGSGWLWKVERRVLAVLCFVVCAALAGYLVDRWHITVG